MLEGFIPSVKRVLPFVLVWCAFFLFAGQVFAGQIFPTEGPPDTFSPPIPSTPSNPDGGNTSNPGGGTGVTGGSGTGGGGADAGDIPANPENVVPVQVEQDCWTSPAGFMNCLVVSFFGNLVALAGSAFDTVITMFITGFGTYYLEYGIGYTVENIWGTIRDVFNLTFIFGLVYIGFQIILGINESSAKRTIPLLILAALLVNFSLFAVKFVIDFSNLAAVQVYSLFTVGDQATATTVTPGIAVLTPNAGQPPSIALAFLNQMGVTSLLNSTAPLTEPGAGITYMFTMVIIFIVLAWVFFAGAILVTIRFAVLIFYMIFSPIMFLGWVFPGLSSYSKKFWSGLLGQAFFAPTLLFMLYISYRVAQGFNDKGSATGGRVGGEAIVGSGDPNSFAIFLPYLIVNVIFIVASLVVAKKMANQGADAVGKINDWALGKARGAANAVGGGLARGAGASTFGLAGYAGRATLGRYGTKLTESDDLKNAAASRGFRGWGARRILNTANTASKASFDGRVVGGLGKKIGIGEGVKGGYKGRLDEIAKGDQKYAEMLGTVGEDDILVKARVKEKDAIDIELRTAKAELGKISDADDRKTHVAKIKGLENSLAAANQKIEQEKNRRVLGSTFANEDMQTNKDKIKESEDKIKEIWKAYTSTEINMQKAFLDANRKIVKDLEKKIKDNKEAIRIAGGGGYVDTLKAGDALGKASSWLNGRSWRQSNYSSDALKKKYEKTTKRSAEDVRNESVVEAITKTAK